MSINNNIQNIETYKVAIGSEESEVEFSVDKIQLLESKTLAEGIVYETLNTFSFLEK